MSSNWPTLPPYEAWRETCDTLHGHTQTLGKLAVALAPPEPQLQHAALRLTARGWETLPLPAPGRIGRARRRARPARPRGRGRAQRRGRAADRADPRPLRGRGDARGAGSHRRTWPAPSRGSTRRPRRCRGRCRSTRTTSTPATTPVRSPPTSPPPPGPRMVLAAFRAPYRGRSTPVNAWWGSFDLAVSLFSGASADPPSDDFIMRNAMDSQEVAVGWWPGDARLRDGRVLRIRPPGPAGLRLGRRSSPAAARWDGGARRVHPRLGRRPGDRRPARVPPWSSRARRSVTRARCAAGTRRCPRAWRGRRPPSREGGAPPGEPQPCVSRRPWRAAPPPAAS